MIIEETNLVTDYDGVIWGWDTGEILYKRDDGETVALQEYPDLMDEIVALCREYFERKLDPPKLGNSSS